MRIVAVRDIVSPIRSNIANAYIDFSQMTASVVAVVTDLKVAGAFPTDHPLHPGDPMLVFAAATQGDWIIVVPDANGRERQQRPARLRASRRGCDATAQKKWRRFPPDK